jgi:hypothetical protein
MGVLTNLRHAIFRRYFSRFYQLDAIPFTRALRDKVKGFNCGDEEWERPLNEWITTDAVFHDMAAFGTSVLLYMLGEKVIGYGSIGVTRRPYPPTNHPRRGDFRKMSIIPMVAMQLDYHGKPWCAGKDERYAGQIMNDLIGRARLLKESLLVLYVDPRNQKAKGLYRKFGFEHDGFTRDGDEVFSIRLS